jgi:hypothetical protein
MNNKFGLMDEESEAPVRESTMSDRLASFGAVRSRGAVDLAAIDAAAAQHGFISREAGEAGAAMKGRRRRSIPSEPTRHLAIRLTESAYNRFVAYADRHELTYHDALSRLMNGATD